MVQLHTWLGKFRVAAGGWEACERCLKVRIFDDLGIALTEIAAKKLCLNGVEAACWGDKAQDGLVRLRRWARMQSHLACRGAVISRVAGV